MRTTVWNAGHGGGDSGAVNGITGHQEKDITLAVAKYCHKYSLQAGIPSVLSRSDDKFMSLRSIVSFTNRQNADICSIHCNAYNKKARGFECFTSKGVTDSDKWASVTLDEYEEEFKNLKPRYDLKDGDADKEASFTVLLNKGKGILFELGFIDNVDEAKFLANDRNQRIMAQCLVNGRLRDLGLPTQQFVDAPIQNIVKSALGINKDPVHRAIESIEWQLEKLKKLIK